MVMRTRMRTRMRRTKRRIRKKTKTNANKRKTRNMRGGFFTGASYLMEQGLSIFQVPPPVPHGNPTLPVNPFPYLQ